MPHTFEGPGARPLSALLIRPPTARVVYVLAHGAGAGMGHAFMEAVATALAARSIATLRYQFPYMMEGSGRPDPATVLEATVRLAVEQAGHWFPDLPIVAGGKSMGGRMTSRAAADSQLPGVEGLAFLGFPLHPSRKPGIGRADHLDRVDLPMLFVQGTRDALAEVELIRSVCGRLGARATLHFIEGADHSFHVLKRSGRTDEDVLAEIASTTDRWVGDAIL
jgi:predicted alpha/beta-hydrolase family hydrolase